MEGQGERIVELTFLGTSSAIPTRQRSLPAIALRKGKLIILFDCGEGTQRQLLLAGLSLQRIQHIFITHLHGDHLFGLPGLIQSMALNRRTDPLQLYCPVGEGPMLTSLLASSHGLLTFEVGLTEMGPGQQVQLGQGLTVTAGAADHTVPALAFRLEEAPKAGKFDEVAARKLKLPKGPLWGELQKYRSVEHRGQTIRPEQVMGPRRPGRVVVYTGDSRPGPELTRLARGAQLLVHDATFAGARADNALESGHSTATEAAGTAREAGVERLVLSHFSQRYKDVKELVEEARAIFLETIAAQDLMQQKLERPSVMAGPGPDDIA